MMPDENEQINSKQVGKELRGNSHEALFPGASITIGIRFVLVYALFCILTRMLMYSTTASLSGK